MSLVASPCLTCPLALQFGDSQQLRLVRILRSTVMVRVGGGWMALDEFLVKNDPCRGKVLPGVGTTGVFSPSKGRLRKVHTCDWGRWTNLHRGDLKEF